MSRARVYIYKVCIICVMCFTTASAFAQNADEVEYRMEIGGGFSMTAYQGDFSESLIKGMQPGGGVVFRRILSPYMALKLSASYAKAKGDYSNAGTVYRENTQEGMIKFLSEGYSFSNSMADLSVCYEYNFLPYGTGKDYRGAKRISPFISLGLGMTYVNCPDGTWDLSALSYSKSPSTVAFQVPIGIGVKYKLGARTNIILDWHMHFTLTDYLDGVKDAYHISSSRVFKNKDSYSTLSLSLTYCFSAKCPTCMKNY